MARSFGRAARWTVGIASVLLLWLSVGGYFYQRQRLWDVAAEHLRLVVSGPSVIKAGAAAEYLVSTTAIHGQPLAAQVEVVLSGPDGKRWKAYREATDERGRLRVVIPADLPLPPQIKFKVVAWLRESREEMEMPLLVEPARYLTQLTADKPLCQPGEALYYRSLTLSQFRLVADRELPLRYQILDPNGVVVPRSLFAQATQRGIGSGVFSFPDDFADGPYTLVVRSDDQASPPEEERLLLRRPLATPLKKAALEPRKAEVTFFPEGGRLVAGLENRIYFMARNSRGEPLSLSGTMVASDHDGAGRGEEIATVQTTFAGMGTFSFTPRTDEAYRLKITSPKGIAEQPKLPEVSADCDLVLATGAGVFAVEKPLEFNIRATRAGMPLVVAASCRGVQVGQQPLATKVGANPVAISLDPAAAGVIRLTVYNYRASPPKPVAERLVYCRPAHRLNVAVTGPRNRYAPGETVELALSVTNEKGQPVPATLSAAVIDNSLLSAADHGLPSLPAYFLLTSQLERPAEGNEAGFYLSDRTKDDVPAAVALDLLLGTQAKPRSGGRAGPEPTPAGHKDERLGRPAASAAAEPPLMYDNLSQIRSRYEEGWAEYRAGQTNLLSTVATAGLFGGLGLVLFVAMLGLMRILSGLFLWIPVLCVIASCVLLGATLVDLNRLAVGSESAATFAVYRAPSPKAKPATRPEGDTAEAAKGQPERLPVPSYAHQHVAGKPGSEGDLAKTLFWNPRIVAGPDGKATLRFQLSDVITTFRVMIDAHSDGRLGSGGAEIVVHGGP